MQLTFKPIDLVRHAADCVRFREDTFTLALGSPALFFGEDGLGAERYLTWLTERSQALPGSLLHAWLGDELVGQLELSQPEPGLGYVHLFYITEPWRHRGLGQQLHDRAMGFFGALGCTRLSLSASVSNLPALKFYERNGWVDAGPRPGAPGVHHYRRGM
ncbi:GNAT family N-acetyltransferase [Pseudomonas sp. KNUC1026]|uniref:GNAT family N-acetyltransferase n=1 Tax=Pseudomonas sp. KNUC1026 TaxID=2893890 RepID=UPI001F18D1E9|nr:GNAT family N-acetyltransferase [Pseudomonas sp. KNUC1026]UFH50848.1 GNAT family N-acetyltransferase [Pseudomonas sp. KNUC1026]